VILTCVGTRVATGLFSTLSCSPAVFFGPAEKSGRLESNQLLRVPETRGRPEPFIPFCCDERAPSPPAPLPRGERGEDRARRQK
jgi:hypothetical protein